MLSVMDLIFTISKVILTVLFVGLGGLLLLGSFSPKGFTARVVLSGSMEPAIGTGSVVFTLPRDSYSVGDVITFQIDQKTNVPTTHRIVEVKADPVGDVYTTRGDNNDVNDFTTVRQNQVLGKVLFHVPYLGFILEFAKTPLGFLVLIGLPAVMIVVEEIKKIVAEVKRQKAVPKENI